MTGREQVIAALKTAYVQGRLTKDEFELRVGQALAMYAELDALTDDIPTTEPAVTSRSEVARQAANKKMIQQGTVGAAGLVFLLDLALVIPRDPLIGVVAGVLLTAFVTVFVAGFLTLLSWALERRSGAQAAQGPPPGTGSDTAKGPAAGDLRGRFPGLGQDPPHTAQASRTRPRRLATTPA